MRVVVARALWYVPARYSSIGLTILKLVKKTDSLKANASRNSPKRGSFCSLFPRAGGLVEIVVFTATRLRLLVACPSAPLLEFLPSRLKIPLIEALLPAHR
jgi:hypothetical protein